MTPTPTPVEAPRPDGAAAASVLGGERRPPADPTGSIAGPREARRGASAVGAAALPGGALGAPGAER